MEMYSKSSILTHIICMNLQVETMKITVVYLPSYEWRYPF